MYKFVTKMCLQCKQKWPLTSFSKCISILILLFSLLCLLNLLKMISNLLLSWKSNATITNKFSFRQVAYFLQTAPFLRVLKPQQHIFYKASGYWAERSTAFRTDGLTFTSIPSFSCILPPHRPSFTVNRPPFLVFKLNQHIYLSSFDELAYLPF